MKSSAAATGNRSKSRSRSWPDEVTPFTIDLHTADHVFKKGHRIMVQVQSTWFPLYDRNPQKFVPNIFEAKEADYQKATQKIYRSKKYPSQRGDFGGAEWNRDNNTFRA